MVTNKHQDELSVSLQPEIADYIASAAKAVLGPVPFVGSLLAELAGTIIPNQRIDRVARFAEKLEEKLANLEQDFVRSQLTNENFTDLLEEALRQAARSTTNERREYIASLIGSSLTDRDIEYVESKQILRILGEINDIEVIWLRFCLVPYLGGDEEFREKHKKIIEPVVVYPRGSQQARDKAGLQKSYKEHLVQLGLLERTYRTDPELGLPEFNRVTGEMETQGYQITLLGKFLLRHIGLTTSNE